MGNILLKIEHMFLMRLKMLLGYSIIKAIKQEIEGL